MLSPSPVFTVEFAALLQMRPTYFFRKK